MIDLSKYKKEYPTAAAPITAASLLLTHDCNLRCKYCFEKHEPVHMSVEVLRKAIDFLLRNAVEYNRPSIELGLFGGEPMLCPDLIEECVYYGQEQAAKYNKEANVGMVTNGTILQPRMIRLMEECIRHGKPIGVQISVDGPPYIHNEYRVTRDGGPSMHLIERNVPIYKEIYKKNSFDALNVHGCLNRKTLPHLFESFTYFKKEWGIDMLWFLPVCEESWEAGDVEIYRQELGKIYDYVMKPIRESKDTYDLSKYAPLDKALKPKSGKHYPCGAGKNYCTVTALGELWPCHHFMFNDPNRELYMGNVFDGVDNDKRRLFLEYDADDMRCEGCDHTECYRCLAVNLKEKGNMFCQVKGYYCGMMKVDQEYQDKIRKELEEMGVLNGNQNKAVAAGSQEDEQFISQCGKVFKDYGDCYLVDLGKGKKETSQSIREAMQEPIGEKKIIDTWVEEGITYTKVREADGKISIYDSPAPRVEEPACDCGNGCCKETPNEFEETVTKALITLLQKIDSLERIVTDKLK